MDHRLSKSIIFNAAFEFSSDMIITHPYRPQWPVQRTLLISSASLPCLTFGIALIALNGSIKRLP
jgi:hypothetical protein